jgi:AraC-like DNA-binding protein
VFSILAISAAPLPGAAAPFQAHFSARSSGPLLNCGFESDGFHATRGSREIARRQWHGHRVYRESSAGVWFRIAGQEFVTRAGDVIVADADAEFEARPIGRYSDESWLLPKALLDPHLPGRGRAGVTRLTGRGGVAALAASYLDSLTRHWDSIPEAEMGAVAETLARLVGIACGADAADRSDAVREGRLAEARRHIQLHLADPHLSPVGVAAALGMSVRGLHQVFEPTGSSFSRYVAHRRLQECRAALLAAPARPVTDIAFAWGFGTLSNFYRAFRAAYGMSPGDLRAAARSVPLT